MSAMTIALIDPWTRPVDVSHAEAGILETARLSGSESIHVRSGDPRATLATVQRMAAAGLVVFTDAGEDTWSAHLQCAGWNALWRHNDDSHAEGCGFHWLPSGTCSGCGALRRLDMTARTHLLLMLTGDARGQELRDADHLWCEEHGFMRAETIATGRICRMPTQSPWHNGAIKRV